MKQCVVFDLEALATIRGRDITILPGRREGIGRLLYEKAQNSAQLAIAIVANFSQPLWRHVSLHLDKPTKYPSANEIALILEEVATKLDLDYEAHRYVRWLLALGHPGIAPALENTSSSVHEGVLLSQQAAYQEASLHSAYIEYQMYKSLPQYMRVTCNGDTSWRLPRAGMIYYLLEQWSIQPGDPLTFFTTEKNRPKLSGITYPVCETADQFLSTINDLCMDATSTEQEQNA